jgi:hypothetical protein
LHNTILAPLVAVVLWSFAMWAWLYATRIPAVTKGKINYDPHRPAEEFHAQLPAQVRWKADNYNNLMEQPTLFYAVTLALALLGAGEGLNTGLAWLYVGLRVAQASFRRSSTLSCSASPFSWRRRSRVIPRGPKGERCPADVIGAAETLRSLLLARPNLIASPAIGEKMCIASAYSRALPKSPLSPRANGALNARPVQDFPRSFRAVVLRVLRRVFAGRASATQAPQLLHAQPAKPEYSIEKRHNNSQKYNVVEHYNNSM